MMKATISPSYFRPIKCLPLSFQSACRVKFGDGDIIYFDFRGLGVYRETGNVSRLLATIDPVGNPKSIGEFRGSIFGGEFEITIQGTNLLGALCLVVRSLKEGQANDMEARFPHFYLQRRFDIFSGVKMHYDNNAERITVEYDESFEELACVLGALLVIQLEGTAACTS